MSRIPLRATDICRRCNHISPWPIVRTIANLRSAPARLQLSQSPVNVCSLCGASEDLMKTLVSENLARHDQTFASQIAVLHRCRRQSVFLSGIDTDFFTLLCAVGLGFYNSADD